MCRMSGGFVHPQAIQATGTLSQQFENLSAALQMLAVIAPGADYDGRFMRRPQYRRVVGAPDRILRCLHVVRIRGATRKKIRDDQGAVAPLLRVPPRARARRVELELIRR